MESLTCSGLISSATPAKIDSISGTSELHSGQVKYGEVVSAPSSTWSRACAFAQTEINRIAYRLSKGILQLPGETTHVTIPLKNLSLIASVGPDRRDIADGFCPSDHFTTYPALWGHEPESMRTISLTTNHYLSPLMKPLKGRPLRKLEDLWPKAGTLMICERIWLKTYRVVASILNKPSLSNVWWPITMKDIVHANISEKLLALWLNSTLGLILLMAYRGDTRGAWIQIKKPTLETLPVLDVEKLSSAHHRQINKLFEKVRSSPLSTLYEIETDATRITIDEGLGSFLDLPKIDVLRQALSREPIISLKPI